MTNYSLLDLVPVVEGGSVGGALANPKLKIYRGSTLVSENDDWSADAAGAFSRRFFIGATPDQGRRMCRYCCGKVARSPRAPWRAK